MSKTTRTKLALPTFGATSWHDLVNGNFHILDALIGSMVDVSGFKGQWTNSTAFVVDDVVISDSTGLMYKCLVAHTSHATNSFAVDRTNNPTYWEVASLSLGANNFQRVSHTTVGSSVNSYDFVMGSGVDILVGSGINFSNAVDTTNDRIGASFSIAGGGSGFTRPFTSRQNSTRTSTSSAQTATSPIDLHMPTVNRSYIGEFCFIMLIVNALSATKKTRFYGISAGADTTGEDGCIFTARATTAEVHAEARIATQATAPTIKFWTGSIGHYRLIF